MQASKNRKFAGKRSCGKNLPSRSEGQLGRKKGRRFLIREGESIRHAVLGQVKPAAPWSREGLKKGKKKLGKGGRNLLGKSNSRFCAL